MKSKIYKKLSALGVCAVFIMTSLPMPVQSAPGEIAQLDHLLEANAYARAAKSPQSTQLAYTASTQFLENHPKSSVQNQAEVLAKYESLENQTQDLQKVMAISKQLEACSQNSVENPTRIIHAAYEQEYQGGCVRPTNLDESESAVEQLTQLTLSTRNIDENISLAEFVDTVSDQAIEEMFRNYWVYKGMLQSEIPSAQSAFQEVFGAIDLKNKEIEAHNRKVTAQEELRDKLLATPHPGAWIHVEARKQALVLPTAKLQTILEKLQQEQQGIHISQNRTAEIQKIQSALDRIKTYKVRTTLYEALPNYVRQTNRRTVLDPKILIDDTHRPQIEWQGWTEQPGSFDTFSDYERHFENSDFLNLRPSQNAMALDTGMNAMQRLNHLEVLSRQYPQFRDDFRAEQERYAPFVENFFRAASPETETNPNRSFAEEYLGQVRLSPKTNLLGRDPLLEQLMHPFPDVGGITFFESSSTQTPQVQMLRQELREPLQISQKEIQKITIQEMANQPLLFTKPMRDFISNIHELPNQTVTMTGELLDAALKEQQDRIKNQILELALLKNQDPQLALKELLKKDPARVLMMLYHTPQLQSHICQAFSELKADQDFDETLDAVMLWGGMGLGAVALLTGVGGLFAGAGYLGATAATTAAVGTVAAGTGLASGLVLTARDTNQSIQHNNAFEDLANTIIADVRSNGGNVEQALQELDEFHAARTRAIISGVFTGADAAGVYIGIRSLTQLRRAKEALQAKNAVQVARAPTAVALKVDPKKLLLQKVDLLETGTEDKALAYVLRKALRGDDIPEAAQEKVREVIQVALLEAESNNYDDLARLQSIKDRLLRYKPFRENALKDVLEFEKVVEAISPVAVTPRVQIPNHVRFEFHGPKTYKTAYQAQRGLIEAQAATVQEAQTLKQGLTNLMDATLPSTKTTQAMMNADTATDVLASLKVLEEKNPQAWKAVLRKAATANENMLSAVAHDLQSVAPPRLKSLRVMAEKTGEKIGEGTQVTVHASKEEGKVIKIFKETGFSDWESVQRDRTIIRDLGFEDVLPKIDEVYASSRVGENGQEIFRVRGRQEERVISADQFLKQHGHLPEHSRLQALRKKALESGLDLELKSANWGVRQDGSVVLFDVDDQGVMIHNLFQREKDISLPQAPLRTETRDLLRGDEIFAQAENGERSFFGKVVSLDEIPDGVYRAEDLKAFQEQNKLAVFLDRHPEDYMVISPEFAGALTRQPGIHIASPTEARNLFEIVRPRISESAGEEAAQTFSTLVGQISPLDTVPFLQKIDAVSKNPQALSVLLETSSHDLQALSHVGGVARLAEKRLQHYVQKIINEPVDVLIQEAEKAFYAPEIQRTLARLRPTIPYPQNVEDGLFRLRTATHNDPKTQVQVLQKLLQFSETDPELFQRFLRSTERLSPDAVIQEVLHRPVRLPQTRSEVAEWHILSDLPDNTTEYGSRYHINSKLRTYGKRPEIETYWVNHFSPDTAQGSTVYPRRVIGEPLPKILSSGTHAATTNLALQPNGIQLAQQVQTKVDLFESRISALAQKISNGTPATDTPTLLIYKTIRNNPETKNLADDYYTRWSDYRTIDRLLGNTEDAKQALHNMDASLEMLNRIEAALVKTVPSSPPLQLPPQMPH